MLGDATIVNSHDVQDCILWIVSKAIPVLCHAPDNSVHHDNAALGTHAPKFSATIRKLFSPALRKREKPIGAVGDTKVMLIIPITEISLCRLRREPLIIARSR